MKGQITRQYTRTAVSISLLLATVLALTMVTGLLAQDHSAEQTLLIPELAISKVADQAQVGPGGQVDYTIILSNTSGNFGDLALAVMSDTLASELTLIPGSLVSQTSNANVDTIVVQGNTLLVTATIVGGGHVSLQFGAQVVDDDLLLGSTVTNTAQVTGTGMLLTAVATTLITDVHANDTNLYFPLVEKPVPVPALQATAPTSDNQWTLSWNQVLTNTSGYRLEEAYDAAFTVNLVAYNLAGNVTSQQVQHNPPTNGIYYYRVRALVGSAASGWSNIVAVQPVSELTLQATLPDNDNNWTISWSGATGGVTNYELQESSASDFSADLNTFNTGSATSQAITHIFSADNVYYYRVRALFGSTPGPWSDTLQVVGGYKDIFINDDTNWEKRRADTSDYNVFYRSDSDHLQIEVDGTNDYVIASPLALAPEKGYEIEFEADFSGGQDRQFYGVVFGGTCPDSSSCFNSHYVLRIQYNENSGSPFLEFKLKYIEGYDSNNQPFGPTLIDWTRADAAAAGDWNIWTVEVEADNDIKIWLGDTRLGTVRDADLDSRLAPYFGFLGQTKENGTLTVRFDDIRIRRQ